MTDSARRLLTEARDEPDRLRRHLLVAAALREALPGEPVVVGGTAEEFWTADEYHQTDLDLCATLSRRAVAALRELGLRRSGRHWFRDDVAVAVEFVDSAIDGDMTRTHLEAIGDGAARIIGVDDLYLDRLRQATVQQAAEGIGFHSALAVAAACLELIDRNYVESRIAREDGRLREAMTLLDAKIRRRVRRRLR